MLKHVKTDDLGEYFKGINERHGKGTLFYRFTKYDDEIELFFVKYYEYAHKSGGIIDGRIQNPSKENIMYFKEMMGDSLVCDNNSISDDLRKWLPRLNEFQRKELSNSLCFAMDNLRRSRKNENIVRNTYIKYMCWLYYRFELLVSQIGSKTVPKILYSGDITNSELNILTILSLAGCDVVLLLYNGNDSYIKIDPNSQFSNEWITTDGKCFPNGYGLEWIRQRRSSELKHKNLYEKKGTPIACTNQWIKKGIGLETLTIPVCERGAGVDKFNNCFFKIIGVEDKSTYPSQLFKTYRSLIESGRDVVIVEGTIPVPTMEEINSVKRQNNYKSKEVLLVDLKNNIKYNKSTELLQIMSNAFIDMIMNLGEKKNLSQLLNIGVCLICWLHRYEAQLFKNLENNSLSCFIHMGGCTNEKEVLFLKLLSQLPVDVVTLIPNKNDYCVQNDEDLCEITYDESLFLEKFPLESSEVNFGTSAYYAERELDKLLYQDSGLYRDKQYKKADSIILQTIYEEIKILWKEEVKYRPGFEIVNDVVDIPVIFTKISGVKDGDIREYWSSIKALVSEDVFLASSVPAFESYSSNPMRKYATEFYKNGRLLRSKIKNHPSYPYGYLRNEVQERIFDKMQVLLERRMIDGISENGTEYLAIATILNLDKDLIRKIQNFDYTKMNPKFVYINAGEQMISIEDSIVIVFLSLIGFDIALFVPTGYQTVERYIRNISIEEHQIGSYEYDLQVPDLRKATEKSEKSWRSRLFGRR